MVFSNFRYLARSAGVSVGDRVGVLTLEPKDDFTVVGVFGFSEDRDTIGGVQFIAFTDEVAQQRIAAGAPAPPPGCRGGS